MLAARLALGHFVEVKHEGRTVRAKACVLNMKELKPHMGLNDRDMVWKQNQDQKGGCMLLSSEQMCVAFQQYFVWLFGKGDGSTTVVNFKSFLNSLPQLTMMDTRFRVKRITASEIQEAMNNGTNNQSPSLNGLTNEFGVSMPDLCSSLLANLYNN